MYSLRSPCAQFTLVSMQPITAARDWPPCSDSGQADGEGVDSVQEGKIRKSRGALFVAIVKRACADQGVVVDRSPVGARESRRFPSISG